MKRRSCIHGAALVAVIVSAAANAGAQDLGTNRRAELNANISFGNASQSTVVTRLAIARADSALELKADGSFTYGEATVNGVTSLSRRSWLGTLTADRQPFARLSPFLLATVESSFETRIRRRYAGGAGAKYRITTSDAGRSDVSLAILAERSVLDTAAGLSRTNNTARLSGRYRYERKFSDKLKMTHVTFVKPEFAYLSHLTATTRTSGVYQMGAKIGLQLSFFDAYDSEARSRGARSANDGEILLGLAAEF